MSRTTEELRYGGCFLEAKKLFRQWVVITSSPEDEVIRRQVDDGYIVSFSDDCLEVRAWCRPGAPRWVHNIVTAFSYRFYAADLRQPVGAPNAEGFLRKSIISAIADYQLRAYHAQFQLPF